MAIVCQIGVYLLPSEKFAQIKESNGLPIAVTPNCEEYLSKRLHQLEQQLATVSELALANELPNAIITDTGLKITQLETVVPDGAQRLIDQTSVLLPVATHNTKRLRPQSSRF
jgi:hypothetical protein